MGAQTEPVAEPAAQQEPAQQEPAAQPNNQQTNQQQTLAENQRFKQFRRQNEQLQQQLAAQQAATQRLLGVLSKDYELQGDAEEVALALEAAKNGVSPEEMRVRNQKEAQRLEEMMHNHPEFKALQEKADAYEMENFNHLVKEDLAAINKAFPDAKVKSLDELGEQFVKLRSDDYDAVTAYAIMQQVKQATAKPVPPVIGAVKQTPAEKEFYTSAEVTEIEKNHPEMLKDPKVMERIMNSMSKWK